MRVANVVSARVLADRATSSVRWRDLRARIASAVVLAPIALACLWFGGIAWDGLIGVLALGLAVEWVGLTRAKSFSWRASGLPYVGVATLALIWLRADSLVGLSNVLFVMLAVWSSDIGAYLIGRLLGGPRLAPTVSPGKTWSGAAGGLVGAMLAGAAVAAGFTGGVSAQALVVAAGLSVIGQAGDLLESAVKRALGVKDSGSIIPGHGGLFDRLDAILAAAPAAAVLAVALGRGVELWR
jgi:phosphatidate cytidylyltransferase